MLHCVPEASLKFQPVFSVPLESHVLYSQFIFLEYTKEPTRCLILCAYMMCKIIIYVHFVSDHPTHFHMTNIKRDWFAF